MYSKTRSAMHRNVKRTKAVGYEKTQQKRRYRRLERRTLATEDESPPPFKINWWAMW